VLADLSSYTSHPINDMTVDLSGTAYVGSFGFDLYGRGAPAPAGVIKVAQDGSHSLAAGDLQFPNGMVVADGGATLVVAETFAGRLTAFTRRDDGSLTDRRTWAQLAEGVSPDGICLDRRGAIWVASPTTRECLRVLEGGEVTDRITVGGRMAVSCTLGGADGASLFVATSGHLSPAGTRKHRDGRIEVTRVPA
jgi:sugar lactone lactonase YvrE